MNSKDWQAKWVATNVGVVTLAWVFILQLLKVHLPTRLQHMGCYNPMGCYYSSLKTTTNLHTFFIRIYLHNWALEGFLDTGVDCCLLAFKTGCSSCCAESPGSGMSNKIIQIHCIVPPQLLVDELCHQCSSYHHSMLLLLSSYRWELIKMLEVVYVMWHVVYMSHNIEIQAAGDCQKVIIVLTICIVYSRWVSIPLKTPSVMDRQSYVIS